VTTPALLSNPLVVRVWRGGAEALLIGVLWAGYSLSRLFADGSPTPAVARAHRLLDLERFVWLDIEGWLNNWFAGSPALALVCSYYYASAHYVVTAAVLLWLWRRGSQIYSPARRVLVLATLAALVLYLVLPMAPPRLLPGYVDVLQLTSADGWWGGHASAPRGLGGYTNQLAAFPSMHAGWALWVAWVVQREVRRRWVRVLAWGHAAMTAFVIVGTGNHWVLDVVAGWLVMAAAFGLVYGPLPANPCVASCRGTASRASGPLSPR